MSINNTAPLRFWKATTDHGSRWAVAFLVRTSASQLRPWPILSRICKTLFAF